MSLHPMNCLTVSFVAIAVKDTAALTSARMRSPISADIWAWIAKGLCDVIKKMIELGAPADTACFIVTEPKALFAQARLVFGFEDDL